METEYLKIFFMSMLPITELRLSIPIGILDYELYSLYVAIVSILGNFIICIPLVYFFSYFEELLKKNYYTNVALKKIFNRTRSKSRVINQYKYYGIMLFVGIPFP